MVTLFSQNNCTKWVNRFGTNSQKTELDSEKNACRLNPAEFIQKSFQCRSINISSNDNGFRQPVQSFGQPCNLSIKHSQSSYLYQPFRAWKCYMYLSTANKIKAPYEKTAKRPKSLALTHELIRAHAYDLRER